MPLPESVSDQADCAKKAVEQRDAKKAAAWRTDGDTLIGAVPASSN